MSETIDLSDLPLDIQQLIDNLVLSKSEALAFRYYSDNQRTEDPAPLEVAVFITSNITSNYLRTTEVEQLHKDAAEVLLKCIGLSGNDLVSQLTKMFNALESRAGRFWYFFPNQAGNGIRLVYEKYSFVFIVNAYPNIQYTL